MLGSGKTAVDACTWLLDNGVEPDRIRWVRPRDAWFHDRRDFQPLDQVGAIMAGISLDAEAGAQAADLGDLFERLEASGRLLRIDPAAPATMYRGTMLSEGELEAVRQIEDVVRLGRVRRIEPDRIVIQQVRHNSPTFNAALIAWVEANRDDDVEKNRLCPPNPYPSGVEDWPRMMSRTWRTEWSWLSEPDLTAWLGDNRLNLLRALPDHAAEPPVRKALERYLANVEPAIERLGQLDGASTPTPA